MFLANDRKTFIMNVIQSRGSVTIHDIMNEFGVSDMTARRDLYALEKCRKVERKFGGAIKPIGQDYPTSFNERIFLNREKKEELCHAAALEIKGNEIVYIDGGSTSFFMARHMGHIPNLRVITNSIPLASELIQYNQINVTLLGGDFDPNRQAVFGLFAEQMIDQLHAHRAFIGSDGISLKNGFSSYYENEARISRKMMDSSEFCYVLADSTKFESDSYVTFSPVDKSTAIFTDSSVANHVIDLYANNSVRIHRSETFRSL